jgi:cubilin
MFYSFSPLIGTFCGSNIPPNIKSFANKLYLKFVSDSSYTMRGFEIEWDGTSTGCGGVLSSTKV